MAFSSPTAVAGAGAGVGAGSDAVWAKAGEASTRTPSDTEHNAAFLKDFTPASSIHGTLVEPFLV
jgi:hypothetical protein